MNVKEDMLKKKKEINEKTEIFIFVFLAFILLTTWAMTQPFNSEIGRASCRERV